MELPIAFFDTAVIAIMGISVLMAFFRGFVKEFFTVLSWIIATVVTVYLSPVVQNLIKVSEGKEALYNAISALVIFAVCMFILSFLFGKIINHLRKNDGLFLDRSLGVLFGFIRGALLICLMYIFMIVFIYDKRPDWVEGKTVKIVEMGSAQLMKLNPKKLDLNFDIDSILPKNQKDTKEIVKKQENDRGYTTESRKQMEDLINEIGK